MTERFKPFAAVYIVLRKDGKVLLARRQGSGFMDGWYSLPAGHLEEGETLTESIIRETHEEIGVDVDISNLKMVHVMHRKSPDRLYIDVYFEASNWRNEPTIGEPDKCDELLWANPDNAPKNTVPYVRLALGLIEKGDIYSEDGWNG